MERLFLLMLISLSLKANATTYYISSIGNDANNGTSSSTPWKTIAKINSRTFLPGDFILFRKGDMWREQLTLKSSGVAGNPITIGAYGSGPRPIINGADVITTGWTNAGGNLWYINNPNPVTTRAMVIIGGTIQQEVASISALNSTGKYFIYVSSTPHRVYVYSTTNPGSLWTEVSKREYCIYGPSYNLIHHVNIVGIECRYAGAGGVVFNGPGTPFDASCIVDNCRFYANRLWGCRISDQHNGDIFKNSTADYNGNGFYTWIADNNTMQNCSTAHTIHYSIRPGFTDGGGFQNYRGKNWVVENCYSIDDNDAIHIDAGGVATNFIIRYNKVFNSKFGSPNTPGFGVGSLGAGAVGQIYYNLAVNCASAAFESTTTMLGTVYVYNNTFYSNTTTATNASVSMTNGANFIYKNNLFVREYVTYKHIFVVQGGTMSTNNYNNYYNLNNSGELFRNNYKGTSYKTLATWRTATSQDANSISANPLFVNKTSDWHLQSTSPCVNKGTNVGLTRDLEGKPIVGLPDIGAFELSSTPSTSINPGTIAILNNTETRLGPTVSVYPNPAKSQANFRLETEAVGRSTITIYDANGSPVLREIFMKTSHSFQKTVNISKLAKGTYTAVINIDAQESLTQKIIKL